jgi:hypothetical protein
MPDKTVPDVTVTLTLRADVAALLSALADPGDGNAALEGVIGTLVDHAWQGALRPGSWERSWLRAVFGEDWLARLERDPDTPHHDRLRRNGNG